MNVAELDEVASDLHRGRERFLALVADVRADLHRYCARMTGSVSDGEDVVQDTLARAYFLMPEVHSLPPLRAWLFQIAHRRALDHLRRYDVKMSEPLEAVIDTASDGGSDPEEALAREQATRAALSAFLELVPIQRSCVILKDVLGHSVDDISALLAMSVPAVKAALHRGRTRLHALGAAHPKLTLVAPSPSPALVRYATLFNARDWDGVRALLAEEVRLDLVSRSQRTGRRAVSGYLTNYGALTDWHFEPAWLAGREVLAAFNGGQRARPDYFIELAFEGDRVAAIRDFRYVPYIARDAALELARAPSGPRVP